MKIILNALAATILASTVAVPVYCNASPLAGQFTYADDADKLVGTWEGNGLSDGGGQQYVVLELRADGTYTKKLEATVNGQKFGGTHSGTWKARGMMVYLSGDGNFPPYTRDLRYLRKVKLPGRANGEVCACAVRLSGFNATASQEDEQKGG